MCLFTQDHTHTLYEVSSWSAKCEGMIRLEASKSTTQNSGTPCHHSVKRAEGGHGIKGIGYTNSALGGGGGRIGCKQIKKRTTRNGKAVVDVDRIAE